MVRQQNIHFQLLNNLDLLNVKQNKGEILVPKQVTMGSVDPPKKESTSVPKSESPKFMKEETLSLQTWQKIWMVIL